MQFKQNREVAMDTMRGGVGIFERPCSIGSISGSDQR